MRWCGSVHEQEQLVQVRAMRTDAAPEMGPLRATTRSTLSYVNCDADHRLCPCYFGLRYFCSLHDADHISRPSYRSSLKISRWAHIEQPLCNLGRTRRQDAHRYFRPVGAPSSSVGRTPAGNRRVHLGRSCPGATPPWDDAADRDGTVIDVRSGRSATCGNTVTAPTTLRCGRSWACLLYTSDAADE